jgi:bifunctional DNase/RNase
MKYAIALVTAIAVVAAVVIYFSVTNLQPPWLLAANDFTGNITTAGLVPVNISIEGTSLYLTNNCSAITFDVTEDQAFSIMHGINGDISQRPLTHDVFMDVVNNFGINILQVKLDRFEDDIYKARMYLGNGNQTLELDMRPSDAIAIAVRSGQTMYVDISIMKLKSQQVC